MTAMDVKEYLERTLATPLSMLPTTAPGYIGIFVLYSNHSRDIFYQPKKEGKILNTIRRHLNDTRQQAAWYWDSSRHGIGCVFFVVDSIAGADHTASYVSEYPEYNW